jgi:hypothetical protein
MCTEAEHLSEIYCDFDGEYDAEYIARMENERLHTIATLAGIDTTTHSRRKKRRLNKKEKGLFLIIQDSRKDDTTLMLVDRRKSKKYWWTHDFSLALKGCLDEMKKVAKRLKRNNVRVVEYNEYLMST